MIPEKPQFEIRRRPVGEINRLFAPPPPRKDWSAHLSGITRQWWLSNNSYHQKNLSPSWGYKSTVNFNQNVARDNLLK